MIKALSWVSKIGRRGVHAGPIKVSVLVSTYNHDRFIKQCLDSVLGQKTAFNFEIIITEDCSTDRTRALVTEYKHRHPRKIELDLSKENLNNNYLTRRSIEISKGEYIAFIDGDDYWTSDKKLQLQADFLDDHPECALCFHMVNMVDEFGNFMRGPYPIKPEVSMMEDLIRHANFIPGPTPMIRRSAIHHLPSWFDQKNVYADWALYLVAAKSGTIGYLPVPLANYRRHSGGAWSSQSKAQKVKSLIACLRVYERVLHPRNRPTIQNRIKTEVELGIRSLKKDLVKTYNQLVDIYALEEKWEEAIKAGREAIQSDPNNASLHDRLGRLLLKSGKLEEAKVAFRSAIDVPLRLDDPEQLP